MYLNLQLIDRGSVCTGSIMTIGTNNTNYGFLLNSYGEMNPSSFEEFTYYQVAVTPEDVYILEFGAIGGEKPEESVDTIAIKISGYGYLYLGWDDIDGYFSGTAPGLYDYYSSIVGENACMSVPSVLGVDFWAATHTTDDYIDVVQKTGSGIPTTIHATNIYAPDYEGVYKAFGVNDPVWKDARLEPTGLVMVMRTSADAETLTLPLTGTNDATVAWGDGTIESFTAINPSHEYAITGDYTIEVWGSTSAISFNNIGDKDKVISISSLGKNGWSDLTDAFYACTNLVTFNPGFTDTSSVTSMANMMRDWTSMTATPDLTGIDTSSCTSMYAMMYDWSSMTTTPDLSGFDTSTVTSMAYTMDGWSSMTTPPDLTGFDTTDVSSMYRMMGTWTSMTTPPDLSGFNTAKVINMSYMMEGWAAMTTPPDLSSFDTSKVLNMISMMQNWSSMGSIDISIDTWDIGLCNDMTDMLADTSITTDCYDRVLQAWSPQSVKPDVPAHFGDSYYSADDPAEVGRKSLETRGWDITDLGPVIPDFRMAVSVDNELKHEPTGQSVLTEHATPMYSPAHDGIYHEFAINKPVWKGFRTIKNDIFFSTYLTPDNWEVYLASKVDSNSFKITDTAGRLYQQDIVSVAGENFIVSVDMTSDIDMADFTIVVNDGSNISSPLLSATGGVRQRYSFAGTWLNSSSNAQVQFIRASIITADTTVTVHNAQLENSTLRVDKTTPSEHIRTTTGPSTTRYYSNENGNTVTDNVVTEATGAPFYPAPYLIAQEEYENLATQSNNGTAWAISGTPTVAQNQIGLDGVTNSAFLLEGNSPSYQSAYRNSPLPVADTSTITTRHWIKKDADETRFVGVASAYFGSNIDYVLLNTVTGYSWIVAESGVDTKVYVRDSGDWWEIFVSATNSLSVSYWSTWVWPALASTEDGGLDTAAVGSCIVGNAEIYYNKTIDDVKSIVGPIFTEAAALTTGPLKTKYSDTWNWQNPLVRTFKDIGRYILDFDWSGNDTDILTLGTASELITDGYFIFDTYWVTSSGVSISSGLCSFADVAIGQGVYQVGVVTAGKSYEVTYQVVNTISGVVSVIVGGTSGTNRSSDGIYTEVIVAGSVNDHIFIASQSASSTFDINTISVKEVRDEAFLKIEDGIVAPDIVTNGMFEFGTGWNLNTGYTISDGVLNVDVAGNVTSTQVVPTVAGKTYILSYDIIEHTSGLVNVRIANGEGNYPYNGAVGHHSITITATTTNDTLYIYGNFSVGFVGKIDNISLKEVGKVLILTDHTNEISLPMTTAHNRVSIICDTDVMTLELNKVKASSVYDNSFGIDLSASMTLYENISGFKYYEEPTVNDTEYFELTMRTSASAETIILPATGTNNFTVDWGDGSSEVVTTTSPTHEYAIADDYIISIVGTCPKIYFNNGGDIAKVISVSNLGVMGWTDFVRSMYGFTNLSSFVVGNTDTSNVVDMSYAFRDWPNMTSTPDLTGLDTSSVTNMHTMLANWSKMISPPDLTNFDTSNVTNMFKMMGTWTAMTTPPDLSGFNTVKVENMGLMMSGWTSMGPIDIPIDTWNIEACTDMTNMLLNTTLTTACYDRTLIAWAAQTVKPDVPVHFGNSTYTAGGAAETARDALEAEGWVITDGGTA